MLLVIHGIGRQRPYETLDAFGRGLADVREVELEPRIADLHGAPAMLRLRGVPGLRSLDVVELHWAPMTEGRIGAWRMLAWWIRTGIAPLNFGHQLPILRGDRSAAGAAVREARNVVLLLMAAGLALASLVWVAAAIPTVARLAWSVVRHADLVRLGALLAVGVPAGLAWALALGTFRGWRASAAISRRHAGRWRGLSWPRLRDLGPALTALAAIAGVVALAIPAWLGAPLQGWYADIVGDIRPDGAMRAAGAVVLVAAAFGIAGWWVDVVGDLVLYVAADGHVDRQQARRHIKEAARRRLDELLDGRYEQVFVAGHSLGSVVAWDAVNGLIRSLRAAPDGVEDGRRLRGLLTFGSPLDKVHAFFRERVREDQAVRAQLLSFLHGFRKLSSERDDGPYAFRRYDVPLDHVQWWNVVHPWDGIADPLVHYRVDRRETLASGGPFGAHGSYWRDRGFFERVWSWLDAGGAATALAAPGDRAPDHELGSSSSPSAHRPQPDREHP